MKPQQQNTDVKGQSHVYVKKYGSEEINVPAESSASLEGLTNADGAQTADKTPTTYSSEVSSGEGG